VAAVLRGPDAGLGGRVVRIVGAEVARREEQAGPLAPGEGPRIVPSRLLVVIDAFDTLAAEHPDLVPATVELARRGGPLGVHLLLVTRHSDAILAGSIRAVTSLRLAPATREPDQALRLLSTDGGAEIPVDDRWFIRLGTGDLTSFRRVLVSGTRAMEGARAPLDVRPLLLRPSARPTTRVTITAAGQTVGPAPLTDVDLVVGAIADLASRTAARAMPLPGPDGLPRAVELAAVAAVDPARRWAVPLGFAAGRARPALHQWDTTRGSLLVIGSSTDETALAVAVAAVSAAARNGPGELVVHAIDRPGGRLAALRDLPQAGAVVDTGDPGGVADLVIRLEHLLDTRAPGERHGVELVAVADLGAVVRACREAGDGRGIAERLVRVVRAGWGVGVLAVAGVVHVTDLPTELAGGVEQRLVLRLSRAADYAAVGVAEPTEAVPHLRAVDAATGTAVQLAGFPGDDVAAGVAEAVALLGRDPSTA
jgi:S-DNA-T family DNA segregation ATPase FtsK/SpoIIIE